MPESPNPKSRDPLPPPTCVTPCALDYAELAALGLRPEALLDFSSNVNPFGPAPGVYATLAALDPAPYPDRSCLLLRQQLTARHGCGLAQVLAGNGSNELIHLLAYALLRPGDVALVIGPTFGEYAHASRLANAQVVEWRAYADQRFSIDCALVVDQIRRLRPRCDSTPTASTSSRCPAAR